jgi:aminoglycoside 3-N-acetyltransferase
VGLGQGDVVLSHVGLGFLGYPQEGASEQVASELLVDAFVEVLGDEGTWLVPTFSYSYPKGEAYDPASTPSDTGPFAEYFRALPEVKRSLDPIFSVAAIGPRAGELLDELPHDCFGRDCVYDRLSRAEGKLCNVGVGFRYTNYVHFVEQALGVPYRFLKPFSGETVLDGTPRPQRWLYNVRDLDSEEALADLSRLEQEADKRGLVRRARVGLGEITCIACRDMWTVCAENVERDPWFLARGSGSPSAPDG